MRIDGYGSSYPITRTTRQGGAVVPYREVQPVKDVVSEEAARDSGQDYTYTYSDLARPVVRSDAAAQTGSQGTLAPFGYMDAYDRPMSSRAARALASYGSTASMASSNDDVDGAEVVGLDLYA
jgi:hypothetical protein